MANKKKSAPKKQEYTPEKQKADRNKGLLHLLQMAPSSSRSRSSAEPVDPDWEKEADLRLHTMRIPSKGKEYRDWEYDMDSSKYDPEEEAPIDVDSEKYAEQLVGLEGSKPKPYLDTNKIATTGIGFNLDARTPEKETWDRKDPKLDDKLKAHAISVLSPLLTKEERKAFKGDNLPESVSRRLKKDQIEHTKERVQNKNPQLDEDAVAVMVEQEFRGLNPRIREELISVYGEGGDAGRKRMRDRMWGLIESGKYDRGNDKRSLKAIRSLERKK
jgi:hypothetical protein